MENQPAIPEPLQKAVIDAIYSGQFAAFVVYYDETAGVYRLHVTAEFPKAADQRYEKVGEMIGAKIHELKKSLVRKAKIGLGPLLDRPLPPGTTIGPEVEHRVKVGPKP